MFYGFLTIVFIALTVVPSARQNNGEFRILNTIGWSLILTAILGAAMVGFWTMVGFLGWLKYSSSQFATFQFFKPAFFVLGVLLAGIIFLVVQNKIDDRSRMQRQKVAEKVRRSPDLSEGTSH
jgi:hypothetical protein